MKRQKYAISLLAGLILTGCQDELEFNKETNPEREGISFHISTPAMESGSSTRGEDDEEHVETLRYLLADKQGKVLTNCYGYLSEGLDRLDIDGLGAGDYTIVFLGCSKESELAQVEVPATLDQTWLHNTTNTLPMEGSYFFKKVDFTIEPGSKKEDYEAVLDRVLSRIKVVFPGIPSAVEAMISSVTVTLDEGCHVYSSLNGDCSYSGEATIKDYEVCDSSFNLTLNTLPSTGTLSGTVKVKAATLSGDSISSTYRFSDLTAEAGNVNRISIALRHPDIKTGFIHIRPQDYYNYDADLMLMEDEPASVMHDDEQRLFSLTSPLALKTWSNQLRIQLYSAAPAENVDIYANFPSLGIDSVHLMHLDRVEALLDMLVPMTFTKRKAQYLDIRGRRVTIPKMDIPTNIEWIVKTDDPFLNRMSRLRLKNWNVSFHNWEEIWPSKAIAPDPKCMRHAIVQMINLALTLDSEEFMEEISSREGQYVDSDIYLTNADILSTIHSSDCSFGLGACNPSSGAHGWGGGRHAGTLSIIIDQDYFDKMYPTENPDTPCNRERECFYHEYSHCLGFTHDGNMTYGSVWTETLGTAYIKAYRAGKIFFHSPDFIDQLPYKRSEAPDWATKNLKK